MIHTNSQQPLLIFRTLCVKWGYFSGVEKLEKPREILLEEVLVSKNYSVLVPVATQGQAHILGRIGAVLTNQHDGEVLALHVARVPPQLGVVEGPIKKEHKEK